ncbi:hypothetical protein QTQ03_02745 [Micromonospora sp. WMMA1363]|uniref:hypothetical protein n=1 Tax=Micromonospora sp. WMMA1363 TaxID=3053985 RepID=UPI00259C94C2|nr:hypothetical protein [Micromonospora sp. WMMA1363]MDM4718566.1 hypothetical protein [Micromonospora sp. WMMA1363]
MLRPSASNDHTAALARAVVSRLAPEELPAFELLAGPYLTGVDESTEGDHLQFGVVEAVTTVTPVVTLVCAGVVAALLRGAEGELEQLGGRATRRMFGALRRHPAVAPPPATGWSREQLAEVHAVAAGRAVALGVEPELAGAIADAVVGALLLDGPEAAG